MRYAVGYTTGDGEPRENQDGEEYIPEHAAPIIDGVAVAESPPLADDEEAPAACSETTKAGEPCKAPPGDDGLCAAHRKQKEATDAADGPAVAADQASADPEEAGVDHDEETGSQEEAREEEDG